MDGAPVVRTPGAQVDVSAPNPDANTTHTNLTHYSPAGTWPTIGLGGDAADAVDTMFNRFCSLTIG